MKVVLVAALLLAATVPLRGLAQSVDEPTADPEPEVLPEAASPRRYEVIINYQIDARSMQRQAQPDALTLIQLQVRPARQPQDPQWSARKSTGLVYDRGFIGLQTEDGTRVMLRKLDGKPAIFLRKKF